MPLSGLLPSAAEIDRVEDWIGGSRRFGVRRADIDRNLTMLGLPLRGMSFAWRCYAEVHMRDDPYAIDGRGHPLARVLGDIQGEVPGPSVVIVGGIHGNEPAGILAAVRVAPLVRALRSRLRGRVVFLAGNCQALGAGLRFVRRDLNRGWTEANLARLRRLEARELGDEDQEQCDLAECITEVERTRRGRLVVVDLHTTSGPSAPFVCFGDTLPNRQLALSLRTTAILGLDEVIDGALAGYWTDRGHIGIAIESGQHRDPVSVERHVSAICQLLVAAGSLRGADVPQLAQHRAHLALASTGQPAVVEVRHRHVVAPGDVFQMVPGFSSFMPVVAGQIVAHDARGAVHAPVSGLIVMPRYQSQGEDGYFIVRAVRPVWLKVSQWLRRAGAPRLLPRLPGVSRDPTRPGHLVIDPAVARAHVADVMHLCGYRRRLSSDGLLVYSSRRVKKVRRTIRPSRDPARTS
jgi:predicted deacylase